MKKKNKQTKKKFLLIDKVHSFVWLGWEEPFFVNNKGWQQHWGEKAKGTWLENENEEKNVWADIYTI